MASYNFDPPHIAAHQFSTRHRAQLEASESCGCFYCLAIFPPGEIQDWIDGAEEHGVTALCPRCGIDSVIGSGSGYPIATEFLQAMRAHWFEA